MAMTRQQALTLLAQQAQVYSLPPCEWKFEREVTLKGTVYRREWCEHGHMRLVQANHPNLSGPAPTSHVLTP